MKKRRSSETRLRKVHEEVRLRLARAHELSPVPRAQRPRPRRLHVGLHGSHGRRRATPASTTAPESSSSSHEYSSSSSSSSSSISNSSRNRKSNSTAQAKTKSLDRDSGTALVTADTISHPKQVHCSVHSFAADQSMQAALSQPLL